MSEQDKRRKLLSKYIDPLPNKKNKNATITSWVKDQDQIAQPESSQDVEQSDSVEKRVRINSSQEQDNVQVRKQKQKKREQKESKKDRKLKKKLRKIMGLGKDEDVDQFMNNLQIDGVDKEEILDYLGKNKNAQIKIQPSVKIQQGTQKKKKKDKKKSNENDKFKMFEKSDSSDLEIPEQARAKTIYRNKDGTIRQQSEKEEKEKRKKQVLSRLAEWQKGMKQQKSDDQHQNLHEDVKRAKDNKIWDDPMKRWEAKNPMKLLVSKFEGAPNRYNIKPGFRWDGVVRGNAFQNRYLQQINLKKAKKDQQYIEYMRDL